MKSIKRGLAAFLAVLLMIPNLPAAAEETSPPKAVVADEVMFNTGNRTWSVVVADNTADDTDFISEEYSNITPENEEGTVSGNEGDTVSGNEASGGSDDGEVTLPDNGMGIVIKMPVSQAPTGKVGDAYFAEDGSYTINIPEANPFFPYEVQFTCNGEVTREWFMTPDDSVVVGGHTFYVSAYFDNTVVTQMSLNVAGDTVIVYPKAKEFTEDGGFATMSLLPLDVEWLLDVDLTAYTPAELTMVSVDSILAGQVALENNKVIWTRTYDDDYTISASGDKLNLSYNTSYSTSASWQMIVGDDDQLAASNIRYIITTKLTASEDWLVPTVCIQDEAGNRTNVSVARSNYSDSRNYDRDLYITIPSSEAGTTRQAYISLEVNPEVFANPVYDHIRVYQGNFANATEAMAAPDITDRILSVDMSQTGAGYLVERYTDSWITMVTFDAQNNVTGCLPFYVYWSASSNYISFYSMSIKTANGRTYVTDYISSKTENGYSIRTYTLYKGYVANAVYNLAMTYYKAGSSSNNDVTAAYVGQYASIAEAVTAGAADVKQSLFSSSVGYDADYSQGVYFTIFVGQDGSATQEIYRYCIKTEEGTNEPSTSLSSGTSVWFNGLYDSDGKYVPSYVVNYDEDSYGEYNYLTILVGSDVDITNLAPGFSTSSGVNLYVAGGSAPEESRKSLHDFSKGPVQYTAAAENGTDSKNYWLQVVKATDGDGWLYINSLADSNANTREENGVTYSTREIMLDSYHKNVHDIFLANMGANAIEKLSVDLVSDVVTLDSYWTLKGIYDLEGFSGTSRTESYGELPNLAKIRFRTKEGVAAGADITGTLTIKSGTTALVVLNLTGTIGDPVITTNDIPQAVKYVPYGTVIQNNNKYSWNRTTYQFVSGTLPAGMEVKPNGEIYGVPTEVGEFSFTVNMNNSYSEFANDTKTYTLSVVENTDENVDTATDTGYDLTQRVQSVNLNDLSAASQTMVSQGLYDEFVDIYLDGVKLVENVDYTSESGSTRITIMTQTLASVATGSHTLGIEFRTQDTNTLKRAAQNYTVVETDLNSGDSTDNNTDTSSDYSTDSYNNGNIVTTTEEVTTISYTVVSGDTLWKIAKKFYGDGSYWKKIFEDNADTIKDPNKIYVGQVIIIYLTTKSSSDGSVIAGTTYVVQKGDTLWKIAQKVYGSGNRWRQIYQANKDVIADPSKIYVGQVIAIPELPEQ